MSKFGNIVVTGSYDHKIKIWNSETKEILNVLDNGAPVEDLLISSNSSILISCGSNFVKVWDLVNGGKMLYSFVPHQKTITSMAFSCDGSFLITGALDRHCKFIDRSEEHTSELQSQR